ncbi:MAG: multidrug effflux MFS transporter, partial [Gammaproteobacteria bacterium]|nr:multidrug effflux MFS transporter [Gammaproteobacteria bacterium]
MFTIMAMVSPVALNIILPALPSIASSLGLTTNSVQLSFSLYLLALAIGQLLLGPLADRFGRRPVLLGGIIVHMLGCLMAAMAHDLFMLLVGRALQALGGCTGIALARTIMLDRYPRDIAAGKIGYITLAIGLAQAIAPTAGGYLNLAYGWQSLFYFSMILGSISWVIV